MFSLRQLQEEHKIWALHNFPNTQHWEPLLGMTEELGELLEAAAATKPNRFEMIDATMDMTVFLTHYANLNNITLESFNVATHDDRSLDLDDLVTGLTINIGKLNHFHLKSHQGIRYSPEIALKNKEYHSGNTLNFLSKLNRTINRDQPNFLDALETVWNKVKQRDWIANKTSAHLDPK